MPKKAKKVKTPTKELQYLGEQIKAERNRCGLTQQELADQAGRGLRHIQGIESGVVNPSYAVLSSIVHRLAMSGNVLFFPDMPQVEIEVQHLLCKFAVCTEDERQIILHTLDCLAEQFLRRHKPTVIEEYD